MSVADVGGCVGKPQENMCRNTYTITLKQREKKQQGKISFMIWTCGSHWFVCSILLRKPSKKYRKK
jgi:hypothetical protein